MNNSINPNKILSKLFALFIFTGYLVTTSFAQIIFFNNGAKILIGFAAITYINGSSQNDNTFNTSNYLENNGIMYIATSCFALSIVRTYNTILHGNGTYSDERNWAYDATFYLGSGKANFNGPFMKILLPYTQLNI